MTDDTSAGQSDRLPYEREIRFPHLSLGNYRVQSPETENYNCAAWAVGEVEAGNWWPQPDLEYFWPPDAPRDGTLEAFVEGYRIYGFEECSTADLEPGFEKIAIYATGMGSPQHVARQLPNGNWTSKLGRWEDIEHIGLSALAGGSYGQPVLFLRRPLNTPGAPQR